MFTEGSAIVTIKTGLSYGREEEIHKKLAENGIAVSHRGVLGHYGIRASPHIYNTVEDVEVFLEELMASLKTFIST
ncbi:hypothetical protein A3L09_02445 [Thermococcus profundus]|uniref:Aminotransferase class V domain-containing protein n=1 Tax=Thermococcus profundus TaxID=49899 RepID=A0A2Z2MCB3_THEPR|nr:hypothetical protein [Thermococcus profundus]ASJ02205.1 hypothetical protein A3L09_02445 [Thermococcus profundus]